MKRWVIAALALAAGCSTGPPTVGARLRGPTAIAPFMGFTTKVTTADGSSSPYLAVASSGGDELKVFDVADDLPVLGPGVVFPLSVPTAPRPLLLASAPLAVHDGKADLLVAVSAGSNELQLVRTWSPDVAVAATVSLGLPADAQVLSVRAIPLNGAPSPRARVLAGATGGRLCVVDFERTIDPATQQEVIARVGDPTVKTLGFDPVDIAVAPDGATLFLATPDAITAGGLTAFGVARVDSTPDASQAWTVTALDAKAPTAAVAAAEVAERSVDPGDANAPDHYEAAPVLRVYALLDPSGCGQDQAIDCGVVTLRDPAVGTVGNLETDPSGQMGYRAPARVPGVPVAIAVAKPVAQGTAQFHTDDFNPSPLPFALQRIVPLSGQRDTTAVAAVSSSDGHVYLVDLGRWGVMNDSALLKDALSNVAVTSATSSLPSITDPSDPDYGKTTGLGLWNDFPPNAKASDAATAVTAGSDMVPFVQVTPGFTDSDTWTISWQGALPQLSAREGVLVSDGTDLYAAIQSADGQHVDVEVGAPELGVLQGDVVEFPDHPSCGLDANGKQIRSETTVADVLEPSPSLFGGVVPMPGGALKLAPLPCPGVLPTAPNPVRLTVRASGLVLTSTSLGIIGRPQLDTAFQFEWQNESTLSGLDLVRVRKARRRFYPTDPVCASVGCYPGLPWLTNPLDPGPAIAFKVGLSGPSAVPPRGASIQLSTRSGITPTSRKPVTGGTVPGGAVPYDKTGIAGHENDPVHFYVPYLDDQMIDFSPAESSGGVKTIR